MLIFNKYTISNVNIASFHCDTDVAVYGTSLAEICYQVTEDPAHYSNNALSFAII